MLKIERFFAFIIQGKIMDFLLKFWILMRITHFIFKFSTPAQPEIFPASGSHH